MSDSDKPGGRPATPPGQDGEQPGNRPDTPPGQQPDKVPPGQQPKPDQTLPEDLEEDGA